ncbi:MAG: PAS domain-containing protein [Alphaproteobacteria bacterium]|nr:PAS domain-containing protein [Alphaproteobacteria bacterium]
MPDVPPDVLAQLPELNPGPVCRLDATGRIEYANPAARAVLGGDDVAGRCWFDLCPVPSVEDWRAAKASGQLLRTEAELGGRPFLLTFAPAPDGSRVFLYGADVSQLKAAEQEAASARRRLADMARFPDMNPGPVLRLEQDGTVLLANGAAKALFQSQELKGERIQELCPDFDTALQRARGPIGRTRHEARIGDRTYSFWVAHETRSGFLFAFGSDVTEQKLAEAAIAEMARFPDMNPGPVVRVGPDGVVRLANRAARALYGGEALVGRAWPELCPGLDPARWEEIRRRSRRSSLECRIGDRDLLFVHTPDVQGEDVFVYGADLTELKVAQRALQQTEKMATLGTLAAGVAHELNNPAAAASRAAQQLVQVFARLQRAQVGLGRVALTEAELDAIAALDAQARTASGQPGDLDPLTRSDREEEVETWLEERDVEDPWDLAPALVAMGLDEDALDTLADGFQPDHLPIVLAWLGQSFPVYALLEEIRQGTGRLSEIVRAMKSYAYLGQAPVQAVDVNAGLRDTLIILRNKLKIGITVDQALDPALPRIEAYGSELNQVWTNLLDNAADAMEGRGRIQLRTFRADAGVVVEVEDDGPGMPAEVAARVFDPFFTTKAPGKGTGLGLHTSYNVVVKKHGGRIEVRSQPGATCFRVWLPLHARPATPAEEE